MEDLEIKRAYRRATGLPQAMESLPSTLHYVADRIGRFLMPEERDWVAGAYRGEIDDSLPEDNPPDILDEF